MNALTRLLPSLALLTALPACDKEEKDLADSATMGETETGTGTEGASETGDPAGPCDAGNLYAGRPCDGGTEYCFLSVDNEYKWGSCVAEPACVPGSDVDDCETCEIDGEGVPYLAATCGESTPLVLNFDGAPVEYGTAGNFFDLGACAATDWPTARTPWLALDRDRSGHIDGGAELFGSATRLRGGGLANHGFTALAELDVDGDGRITPADPGFAELVLWADADADRRSSGLELQSLASLGLVAIELSYSADRRCDGRDNCEVERASFVWRDALGRERSGEVVDVHLACQ